MATNNLNKSENMPVKILLVDDEPTVRNSISEILQLKGFEVILAENGQRALEIYEKEAPDIGLILLDMTMPGLSGMETLKKIREQDMELPIILLSGFGQDEIDGESSEMLKTQFLRKPFKVAVLIQTIQDSLAGN
ncbi:MAG: response regulator [Candidatus Promineifilaceae bacterium]